MEGLSCWLDTESIDKITNALILSAERARPYLQTIETHDMGTDFINATFVDVSIFSIGTFFSVAYSTLLLPTRNSSAIRKICCLLNNSY